MKKILPLILLATTISVHAQLATPASAVKKSIQYQASMQANSIVKNVEFTNIGPTVMSGRVVDLAVNPNNPTEFYVAYASGGLWYTNNNGTSFEPVMDNAPTQNIGDIAVDWNNGTLWVGTGENNSSRSSYAGIGILKSTDKGATWQNMGLEDAHHIGRIVINQNNPQEVVVGVLGHLYSKNAMRGIYKTTDGGETWTKSLSISDKSGIVDVAVAPEDPNMMYAAAWEKDRKAWHFEGSGSGSGIYKSTDAGSTWNLISTAESGFPTGSGVGRIGLAVYDANTVYAVHDSQFHLPKEEKETSESLEKDDFKTMSASAFAVLDDKKLNDFLKGNGFPKKHTAKSVKEMVKNGKAKPSDIALYLEDANSMLFNIPIIGAEVYLSTDGGTQWTKQNEKPIEGLFYSYGYYFAQIRVASNDKNKILLAGVPLIQSIDGGKTFSSINGDNMHSDHHAIWINPKDNNHIVNGNDGGVNITYDGGEHWLKSNTPAVGQFYYITTDNETPYNVYGGLQDNGVWKGAHNAPLNTHWHSTGAYPWKGIIGGDGMQVQVDNRNSDIVISGYQFGNYIRTNLATGKRTPIQPKHELGETPLRFNWQTPILLSKHHQDILYLGSNKLHRSFDQGDSWETISGDLTKGVKKGNVAFGTTTVIEESPFTFGKIYVGTDDGNVYRTNNGGQSWSLVNAKLPANLWVSSIHASTHNENRVYLSLNGYRNDNFSPYIYKSTNAGASWELISASLPMGAVNSVIEDPENEQIIYAGTDTGAFISFNQGNSWEAFSGGVPNVAVHDVVVQKKAKHLLLGTHGRSIYKADISNVQRLTDSIRKKALHIFKIDAIRSSNRWGKKWSTWGEAYTPNCDITYFTNKAQEVGFKLMDSNNNEVYTSNLQADAGLNTIKYQLVFSDNELASYQEQAEVKLTPSEDGKVYLPKGVYRVTLVIDGIEVSEELEIK